MFTKIKSVTDWCKKRLALCITVMVVIVGILCATGFLAVSDLYTYTTAEISDGQNTVKIKTKSNDPNEILKQANIVVEAEDKVDFKKTDDKISISIVRAFPVIVTVGNSTTVVKMTGGTVGDALKKANVTLGEYDICSHEVTAPVKDGLYIDVVDIEIITETYTETLPYTTKVVYSDSLEAGKKQVTGGQAGAKTITVKKKLVNGAVTETQVVSEVVKPAVEQKTIIGTKKAAVKTSKDVKTISSLVPPKPIELDKNGAPVSYKKVMTFEATAYYADSTVTSTGKKPRTGYIAVNPNIIPYGTKMYIVSSDGKYVYGYAVAEDTGGFAKKNPYQVDLFFNSIEECLKFGRRNVKIYFL